MRLEVVSDAPARMLSKSLMVVNMSWRGKDEIVDADDELERHRVEEEIAYGHRVDEEQAAVVEQKRGNRESNRRQCRETGASRPSPSTTSGS